MATRATVLVVEDEPDLAELLKHNIEQEGYACRVAMDGCAALDDIAKHPPDLIVLDRMLPGTSGDEVVAELRRDFNTAHIPVLMLTAKADESDELVGLALGADDYITKPFSMKRLLARIAAALRRSTVIEPEKDTATAGPITLYLSRYEVAVNHEPVALTTTEFKLLRALIQASGRVLTREHLIDKVMGSEVVVTNRTVDVHITSLRRKLNDAAAWIHTVRGVGYACRAPV